MMFKSKIIAGRTFVCKHDEPVMQLSSVSDAFVVADYLNEEVTALEARLEREATGFRYTCNNGIYREEDSESK